MKNLKKFLPLFAFVVGLTLVFTQSAFKASSPSFDEWGQYTGPDTEELEHGKWYKPNALPSEDLKAICIDDIDPCRYQFNGDPNNGGTKEEGSMELGVFDIVKDE